jgi:hypothetical protein
MRIRQITRRLRHPKDAAEKAWEKLGRGEGPNLLTPTMGAAENTLGSADGFEDLWNAMPSDPSDHDAGSTLAETIYRIVRRFRPEVVVETGVARGATSFVILSAFRQNSTGRLYSIDLPPERPDLRSLHTSAVPHDLRDRWDLRLGSSRRLLPALLEELVTVDVFIHDSAHTQRNMRWEYELAWPHLRPGGFLLSDDIHRNAAFGDFVNANECVPIIGETGAGGLYGVAIKPS